MRQFLALAILFAPVTLHAQIISGTATALDGDSLTMGETQIRLHGIDAVEGVQTCQRGSITWNCGEDAAARLRQLIQGKQVTCTGRDTDQYGRMVSTCRAGAIDLADVMVRSGLAVALPQFSSDYLEAEERAKANRVGIWGSQFEMPAAYRAANPRQFNLASMPVVGRGSARSAAKTSYSSKTCVIKGNRNRSGEWIYHLPGMPYYDVTRPEELFCSEAQAVAAGYRRAIVRR